MQPRRHRMRRQARRESSRAWIASGATVTVKTYARRYGAAPVHRLPGPDRPRIPAAGLRPAVGAPASSAARPASLRHPASAPADWIMIDGRPYFVAGYTPGGAPYGIYLDETGDDDLTAMITPGRPGMLSDLDLPGP